MLFRSVLVEGYTDVIMSHQAGILNVVATSGTALTPYQLKILKRYSENLILGFDMDVAGDSATKRGIDLAQSQGFNIKIVRLQAGKDAAEIILKNQKDWETALAEAKSILDFYFETAFFAKNPKTPEGKKEISKILLPILKRIPNQIEKSFWLQKLSKNLEVREEDLREELKKAKLSEEIYGLEPEEIITQPLKSRKELLEERIITLILKSPQNLNLIEKIFLPYFSPEIQEILTKLEKKENPKGKDFFQKSSSPSLSAESLVSEFFNYPSEAKGEEETHLFDYLSLKAEVEEIEEKDIEPEIKTCLKEIQSLEIKNKLDELSKEIKKAEEIKDGERIEKLTQEFNQLAKEIK